MFPPYKKLTENYRFFYAYSVDATVERVIPHRTEKISPNSIPIPPPTINQD